MAGQLSSNDWLNKYQEINLSISEWSYGPPWYYKPHFWNYFSENNGGSPTIPTLITYGATYTVADFNLFYITNAFEFKWRNLKASIDFGSEELLDFGRTIKTPRVGWSFEFSPIIRISYKKLLFGDIEGLKEIGLRIEAIHTVRFLPIVGLNIQGVFIPIDNSADFSFNWRLIQW
jgi:hypothetical protein